MLKLTNQLCERKPDGTIEKHKVYATSDTSKDHALTKYDRISPNSVWWFEPIEIEVGNEPPVFIRRNNDEQ